METESLMEKPNLSIPSSNHSILTRFLYFLEQLLFIFLLPFGFIFLLVRSIREPRHLQGLCERFGFGDIGKQGSILIYAASVGETRAASSLIRELRNNGYYVLLTHLSPAGLEEGYRLFPDDNGITHRYMALDFFWIMRFFFWRAKPIVGAVLEIEIWPSMLCEARRAGIPMVLINGNLLDKSIADFRGIRKHLLRLYLEFTHIFTRTPVYKNRYLFVGVEPNRVTVTGDLKYDQWVDPKHVKMAALLRSHWQVKRVLMIASSVKDEEPQLFHMVDKLLREDKDLGVLWAPRSPQRFESVANGLIGMGWSVVRRTDLGVNMDALIPIGCRIIIGDSIGEMNAYYPVSDLVFVGASLVDHGGHNIIEPMVFGKPVLMGPSFYGVAFVADLAAKIGAFASFPNIDKIAERIQFLFATPSELQKISKVASSFHKEQNLGGASKAFQLLDRIIKKHKNRPSLKNNN